MTPASSPRATLSATPRHRVARCGMTLIELLVVIVLITTLVSTAIPVISPGGDGRRVREASRNVNAYFQGAQARAIETGRPFGVALRRLSETTGRAEDNAACVRLEYVEVPPSYSGFSQSSAVRVALNPGYRPLNDANATGDDDIGPVWIQFVARSVGAVAGLPPGVQPDLVPTRFLRPGDTVEIAGRLYTLLNGSGVVTVRESASGYFEPASGALVTFAAAPEGLTILTDQSSFPDISPAHDRLGNEWASLLADSDPATNPEAPYWTAPAPYKVRRQPAPAAGEPYELPAGAAIDLSASVLAGSPVTRMYSPHVDWDDSASAYAANGVRTDPVMVLFAPEGRIHRVHGLVDPTATDVAPPAAAPQTVTSYVALCVGRRELIPVETDGAPSRAALANPIDLTSTAYTDLPEPEQQELTDQYNWLNLTSRWVVIGGQTGAVSTIEGVSVTGLATTAQQIAATLENAPRRRTAGGR